MVLGKKVGNFRLGTGTEIRPLENGIKYPELIFPFWFCVELFMQITKLMLC